MAVVVGLLLVLFCMGVVLYPFGRGRRPAPVQVPVLSLEEVAERRRAVYSDIEILEMERGLGHVDEEEYRRQLREYRMAAAATFRDQERLEQLQSDADQTIEQELRRLRAQRQPTLLRAMCAACGQELAHDIETCSQCGTKLDVA